MPGLYIGPEVFPAVSVQKLSDKYWTFTKGDWLRRAADVRAPGTRAPRADYGVSTSNYSCVERAIAKNVPNEVQDNADNPMNPVIDATKFVTELLLLEQEVDIAAKAFGTGWSSSAAPSASWSASTSLPVTDVSTARGNVASTIGREPNIGVIGRGGWQYLTQNPEILDRIRYAAGPGNPAIATMAAVAALFQLEKMLVGVAIQNTGNEGAADSISYVWGRHMLVAYVSPTPALMTPSAGYLFTFANREISRFYEEQERNTVIEARASWDTRVVSADAAHLITNIY
jgi:hypothetical protein